MDLLNESERRFTKKLCDSMIPVMIEAFWEIWLEAKKENVVKNTNNNTKVFQELLRAVKTWNSSISLKNSEAITKNQPLFPNLLAAVFVIHVKILSAIRTDRKSKKICIKLPAIDVFTQRCYEACAKDLYESPFIIVENNTDVERKENLTKRFHIRICEVVEDLIPTAEILQTYLPLPASGEDLNLDQDAEDEDDVPDLMDEVPQETQEPNAEVEGIPTNQEGSNMEFGTTPGGVDTTVTTNASFTPPSVPGATPGGTPAPVQEEESLFPEAPEGKMRVVKTQ